MRHKTISKIHFNSSNTSHAKDPKTTVNIILPWVFVFHSGLAHLALTNEMVMKMTHIPVMTHTAPLHINNTTNPSVVYTQLYRIVSYIEPYCVRNQNIKCKVAMRKRKKERRKERKKDVDIHIYIYIYRGEGEMKTHDRK